MSSAPDSLAPLGDLLDRAAAGDESARADFAEHLYRRLKRLCELKLALDFRIVAAHHDLDSVVHNTWIDVATMLRTAQVNDTAHLLKLLGRKVRYALCDMASALRNRLACESQFPAGDSSSAGGFEPGQSTLDPARLAEWGNFHAAVAALPDDERLVVDLHYLCDIDQAEIARRLGLHPRAVSRTWAKARQTLARYL